MLLLGREETQPVRLLHQPHAIARVELLPQVHQVCVDGAAAHAEPRGDLRIGEALGQQRQDLCLARRDPGSRALL
jgi:hypothetical protein